MSRNRQLGTQTALRIFLEKVTAVMEFSVALVAFLVKGANTVGRFVGEVATTISKYDNGTGVEYSTNGSDGSFEPCVGGVCGQAPPPVQAEPSFDVTPTGSNPMAVGGMNISAAPQQVACAEDFCIAEALLAIKVINEVNELYEASHDATFDVSTDVGALTGGALTNLTEQNATSFNVGVTASNGYNTAYSVFRSFAVNAGSIVDQGGGKFRASLLDGTYVQLYPAARSTGSATIQIFRQFGTYATTKIRF